MNGKPNMEHAVTCSSYSRQSDSAADLHLSGSDPRLFPGILAREHRSGSLKSLGQTHEKTPNGNGTIGKTAS